MEYFLEAYEKYANFRGRANRKRYIIFLIVYVIIWSSLYNISEFLDIVFILISTIPMISLTARRLHDINRSGWWQLLYAIPIINFIILLILLFKTGDEGENNFGLDPLNEI